MIMQGTKDSTKMVVNRGNVDGINLKVGESGEKGGCDSLVNSARNEGGQETGNNQVVDNGEANDEGTEGKIFVGGLSWKTGEESLHSHFEQYARVKSVNVMTCRRTGQPRGFAFVTFEDPEYAQAIWTDEHYIDDRKVEVKPSVSRDKVTAKAGRQESFKVFVGGLVGECKADDLTTYFSQFGKVQEATIMMDRVTTRSRGFGFVSFETLEGMEMAVAHPNHVIKNKWIEVKRALPRVTNMPGSPTRGQRMEHGSRGDMGMPGNYVMPGPGQNVFMGMEIPRMTSLPHQQAAGMQMGYNMGAFTGAAPPRYGIGGVPPYDGSSYSGAGANYLINDPLQASLDDSNGNNNTAAIASSGGMPIHSEGNRLPSNSPLAQNVMRSLSFGGGGYTGRGGTGRRYDYPRSGGKGKG